MEDRRAAARLGRRSTIADTDEVASTGTNTDSESHAHDDSFDMRFRASLELRTMSSIRRVLTQEYTADAKVLRKCKFRLFKVLMYSTMAIISLAFLFHLLNFTHETNS